MHLGMEQVYVLDLLFFIFMKAACILIHFFFFLILPVDSLNER